MSKLKWPNKVMQRIAKSRHHFCKKMQKYCQLLSTADHGVRAQNIPNMKIVDLVWEWAAQKEQDLIWKLFSFGEALEFLASEPEIQIEIIGGECPFVEAWYSHCCEVLDFRERLNNRSFSSFYDQELLDSLDNLSQAFDDLAENECIEGNSDIYNLKGWCEIRNLGKLPLSLIDWVTLKEYKSDIYKML
jgi:hypothetical protein